MISSNFLLHWKYFKLLLKLFTFFKLLHYLTYSLVKLLYNMQQYPRNTILNLSNEELAIYIGV